MAPPATATRHQARAFVLLHSRTHSKPYCDHPTSLGLSPRARLGLEASRILPIFVGATIGFWTLREASEPAQFSELGFTTGLLMAVVVEEVPEAHRG